MIGVFCYIYMVKKVLGLFLILTNVNLLLSQNDSSFYLNLVSDDQISIKTSKTINLNETTLWKFHLGDSLKWASKEYKDDNWKSVPLILPKRIADSVGFESRCWFRLKIEMSDSSRNQILGLEIIQAGASEIYLDGKLLHKVGRIGDSKSQQYFNPQMFPIEIYFDSSRYHLLAVRYSNPAKIDHHINNKTSGYGLLALFSDLSDSYLSKLLSAGTLTAIFIFYATFLFALSFLHLLFYLFYRSNRSNLYYCIFALTFGILFILILKQQVYFDEQKIQDAYYWMAILPFFYQSSLLAMLYTIFYNKILKIFWIWFTIFLVNFGIILCKIELPELMFLSFFVFAIESLRLIIVSIYRKKEGSWILGTGVIVTIVFFAIFVILNILNKDASFQVGSSAATLIISILAMYATLSIPLSMTIYLARDFAKTSRNLEKKLLQVEELSAKSIEQEKEKALILENQNLTLEKQVKERTSEISAQKKVIEEKNKDITDSINYAMRIQESTLPPKELKYKLFPDAFVLFKPKDIVSGDFYWFYETDDLKYIAAADCTGHGVPGALVSMICTNALNRSLKEFGLRKPDEILNKTRELVLETFEKSNRVVKDGMDISLACLPLKPNSEKQTILWAGANNPVWYITKGEFKEITADKQSIGKNDKPAPFTCHTFELYKGDSFYLFSDGYADQFGGPKGKKLKYKTLQDFILSMQDRSMPDQEKFLDEKFEEWKNWPSPDASPKRIVQIDDVLVIGVKV